MVVGVAAVDVRIDRIRLESDGFAVIGNSLVVVAFAVVGEAPVGIGVDKIWLQTDRFAELSNGKIIIMRMNRFETHLKGSVCLVAPAPLACQQQQEENPQP